MLTRHAANVPDELLDPVAVALHVGALMDALGVRWVVGGSMASAAHGGPRATQNVDMVVELRRKHEKHFLEALDRDYYIDTEAVSDAGRNAGSFNAVHFTSGIKVAFFVAGDDAFETERLNQRQRVDMPGGPLYVDTAENTLLRKLEWYRRGGEVSERQWRDVQAIARIQGDRLDRERLRVWAVRLGVTDLLERLLTETTL